MSTELIPVPSGQAVTYLETVTNQPGAGLTYRFRFVAPGIARQNGQADFAVMEKDMEFLCREFALPRVASTGPQPDQIVISLSDRPTTFGTPEPDATQFFEAYRLDGAECIWEPF